MSYVNKKIRVFKEAGDVEVQRKRSDGRMKTYLSATDARAWCDSTEDRRQYILDLVRQGDGKGLSLGKYIPIEAIIDILLANKNNDIKRLQNEIDELKRFIKKHGLEYEEKPVRVVEPEPVVEPPAKKVVVKKKGSAADEEEVGEVMGRTITIPDEASRTSGPRDTTSKSSTPGGIQDTTSSTSEPGVEGKLMRKRMFTEGGMMEDTSETTTPFATDSEDAKTSPRYGDEDEKAAAALLAGKTPEEQVEALKKALADCEALHNAERDLAVRAIEQLENIKDIVDGGEGNKHPTRAFVKYVTTDACGAEIEAIEREIASMKSKSSPEVDIIQREVQVLKKYCCKLAALQKENADLKDMLKDGAGVSLNEVIRERDRLKARVQELEKQPSGAGTVPQGTVMGRTVDEDSELKMRLDALHGLEDEVRKLRDRAATTVQPAGDTSDRDALLAKIRDLERETDNCKSKLKELEILRVERNCLKMRVDDLQKVQQDYEDLLKKTKGFESTKAECAMYKSKYEEMKNLEAECNELRAKVQRCQELENERQILMKEIEDCECCMNNQDEEIKRLTCHIDCLTQNLDQRQDEMKVQVLTMRAHIEKKDVLIQKSEQQLADVQDQLRTSIEQLSCETTCLRDRIDELEDEVEDYQKALATKEENYKNLEEKNKNQEEKIKNLLNNLQSEKNKTTNLEDALRKAIKSDEHLKRMLEQAKCAIKCITQKLGKHDLIGVGRLEAERENYLKKIKELEESMTEQPCAVDRGDLEEELMRANEKIRSLNEQLEAAKQENDALRKLATELQNAAKKQVGDLEEDKKSLSIKSQEMGDKCDELRAKVEAQEDLIRELRKQLEACGDLENKLREKDGIIGDMQKQLQNLKQQLEDQARSGLEAAAALAGMSMSGDDDAVEMSKLRGQLSVLNAENDRLAFDLENQKRECEDATKKLREKIQQLENEAERRRKLEEENEDKATDAGKYKKEGEILRDELDKLKKQLDEANAEITRLMKELENREQIEMENIVLKQEINRLKQELATTENEKKDFVDALDRLKKELDAKNAIEKDNVSLSQETNKLKKELEEKAAVETENKVLKDEANRLKKELEEKAAVETENRVLKDETNRLRKELENKSAVEKENKDLKDQLNKTIQELMSKDALEVENKDLKDEVNKLKRELEELKKKCASAEELTAEMKRLEDENKKLKSAKEALENDARNLQSTIEGLENDKKNLKSAKDAIEKDAKNLQSAMEALENEKKNLKSAKEAMEKDAKNLQSAIEALENEKKNLKSSKEALENDARNLQSAMEALKNETKDLKNAKDALDNENKKLKSAKEALENDAKNLQSAMENLENETKNLKSAKNALENENKNLKDTVKGDTKDKDFAKERDNLLSQIATQKQEIADLLNKINQPQKTDDTSMVKELEKRGKENDNLKSTIEDLEKQLMELQMKQVEVPKGSPEIDKTIKDLMQNLEKEETRARVLEEQLKMCQKTSEELSAALKKCQNNNDDLMKRIAQLEAQGEGETMGKKDVAPVERGPVKDDRRVKELEARVKELEAKVKMLEAELATREKQFQDMVKDYERRLEKIPPGEVDNRVKDLEEELAKRKKECSEMITSLKEQYDRDIKNLQKENQAAIDKLQKAHQDAIQNLSKEHDNELTKLKEQLRENEAIKVKPVEEVAKEPSIKEDKEKPKVLTPMTFTDACICNKLPAVIPIAPCSAAQEPVLTPRSIPAPQMVQYEPPTTDDRLGSIKKIVELENRLLMKQEHTKQKISTLQCTVEKFKRELELERQKNTDLINRYTNQAKTVANMKVEMDIVKRESFQDKRKLQQLNLTLQNILENTATIYSSTPKPDAVVLRAQPVVPHFHTELTLTKNKNNKFQHQCVMKRPCQCKMGDISSDSFEIDE